MTAGVLVVTLPQCPTIECVALTQGLELHLELLKQQVHDERSLLHP